MLFSQVQILLVMILFLAVAGSTKAGRVAAGQVAHFSEALLVFLPLVLASHLLTQVRYALVNKEKLQRHVLLQAQKLTLCCKPLMVCKIKTLLQTTVTC